MFVPKLLNARNTWHVGHTQSQHVVLRMLLAQLTGLHFALP